MIFYIYFCFTCVGRPEFHWFKSPYFFAVVVVVAYYIIFSTGIPSFCRKHCSTNQPFCGSLILGILLPDRKFWMSAYILQVQQQRVAPIFSTGIPSFCRKHCSTNQPFCGSLILGILLPGRKFWMSAYILQVQQQRVAPRVRTTQQHRHFLPCARRPATYHRGHGVLPLRFSCKKHTVCTREFHDFRLDLVRDAGTRRLCSLLRMPLSCRTRFCSTLLLRTHQKSCDSAGR
jgi:hypothetical protein